MPTIPSFKDMPVWQRSMRLAADIYQITSQLPATERLGISSSLQSAAVQLPTVLAVGTKSGRSGFRQACISGRQSAAEVETLLILVQQAYPTVPVDDLLNESSEIQAALLNMAKRLAPKPPKTV